MNLKMWIRYIILVSLIVFFNLVQTQKYLTEFKLTPTSLQSEDTTKQEIINMLEGLDISEISVHFENITIT